MENDDVFDALKAANPYVGDGSTPTTTTSPEARFKEITMQPHETETTRRDPAALPSRWRPMVAVPSALAVVAAAVVSVQVFGGGAAPSAYAQVNEAAQNSASYDSGRLMMEMELREIPEDAASGTLVLDYRFEGDDFSMTEDLSGLVWGEVAGELAGEVAGELADFAIIQVGDTLYTQLPGLSDVGEFYASDVDDTAAVAGVDFVVDPETMDPANIIGVLEKADDFGEVEGADGAKEFRGSVTRDAIVELGVGNLPPGLAFFAEDDSTDVPETLDVTVVVEDGQIDQLVVDVVGDTPDGYTDATITVSFSEFGEPQNIEAPPTDQIADGDFFDGLPEDFEMPEGFAEALETLEELTERRPGLCETAAEELDVSIDPEIDADAFEKFTEVYTSCLEDAGESEAAEALRMISELNV